MDDFGDGSESEKGAEQEEDELVTRGADAPSRRTPAPLDEIVYRRLHNGLAGADRESVAEPHSPRLETLGSQLREWRIGRNLNRATFAERVGIDGAHLLILENGLAVEGDITKAQLVSLLEWLAGERAPARLLAAVGACLDDGSQES